MDRPEPVPIRSCPSPEIWVRFATGGCSLDEQSRLVEHLAACADCASRLRDVLDAVSPDPQPLAAGEADAVDVLADRLDQRRQEVAAAMARRKSPSSHWRRWMPLVAAIVLLVGGIWLVSARWRNRPPLNLLADAYTARRTMELQVSGAAYAPLQVSRAGTSLDDVPPALLQSQLEIKRHLAANPEEPAWLHAQGRAQLLLWQYDAALASFQAAADLGAASAEFLVDYASAYYERAERTSTALDYARALEKLGQALQQRPEDAAALFNRGIVHAKLHQYSSAIDDFEQALRVQTDPRWRHETETRLQEARRLAASVFGLHSSPPDRVLAESGLEDAMTSALAAFFRGESSSVRTTAAAMLREHQDPWLEDVLRLKAAPETRDAVETLSAMARLRVAVNPDYSRTDDAIQRLAGAALAAPLRVWRDYEVLYRDTRSSAVNACSGRTDSLIAEAAPYPWLESQMQLESSLCSAAAQDFAGAARLVDRAEQLMNQRNLELASIRIFNFRGQRLAETGYFREALQTASDALARFDAGIYPPRRAYDFHGIAMLVAGQLNLPHTGYGATRMMADIGQKNGLPLFDMVGHCRHSGFALSLGFHQEAEADLAAAATALQRLGNNPTAKIYWRTSRVAWLESEGDANSLYAMLAQAHGEGPAGKEDLYFNRKLIAALCRLESRAGNRTQVEGMASAFWREAAEMKERQQVGALRGFRPELESVSQSLTAVRLQQGDQSAALDAWRRFLTLDEELLGGRPAAIAVAGPRADASILTVAVLGDKVALWLHSGQQSRFGWAAESASSLDRRVRRLRRLCSLGASRAEVVAEARALYRNLFPHGAGAVSRVYIRARGSLNSIPLAEFSQLDEGRETVFSYLPFQGEPEDVLTTPQTTRMTIVAATSFDSRPGVPALPDTDVEQEIAGVRRAFSGAVVIRGSGVTARTVESAAGTSQALHFTGHAAPWRGTVGLLVAPDNTDDSLDGRAGIWSMGRPRSVNAGLVVLSACSTGTVEDAATVESGQLATSMLLAGARQVVVSLWDVDSTATTMWNLAFYRLLAEGRQTAEAMKLASEELRANPQWESPKYWAGFALYQH